MGKFASVDSDFLPEIHFPQSGSLFLEGNQISQLFWCHKTKQNENPKTKQNKTKPQKPPETQTTCDIL